VAPAAICFALLIVLYWVVDHDATGVMSRLPAGAYPYARLVAASAVWFAAAWVATGILIGVLQLEARRRGADKLPKLLIHITGIVVFFLAALAVVSLVFGQSLTGLLTTSGVLVAIIGFSIQKSIADIVAGIGLNFGRTINLGDWIETATGAIGKVIEISSRTTHLETIDGHLIVIPNSTLSGGAFTNFNSPQRHMRFSKSISVDYNVPTERVVRILDAALKATDGVLQRPPAFTLVMNCGNSGVDYSLFYWVADYPESFRVTNDVLSNALKFLDQAGISTVFPKQDITLFEPAPRHVNHKVEVGEILSRMPFFTSLEPEALKLIEAGCKLREFRPDTVVVREGDAGASLFVVIAGLLDVSKQVSGGPDRRLGRIVPGDLFGELSLLTGAPRSATVTASSHATLVEIDKQQLEPVLARHPESIAALSQFIAERAAANQATLAASAEEKQEIARLGAAAFMRRKIAQFFGA
jgi:small-conductance mechanosensitive channel/CRP-like cAMP-binding protein